MNHLSLENVDVLLILLVGYTESLVLSQDHHGTLHEVEHDVLELGLPCFFVINRIELDVLIFNNIEKPSCLVTRYETSALEGVILLPNLDFLVLIVLLLEKEDLLRASGNKNCVSKHDQVAKVKIGNLLICVIREIFGVDFKRIALSIETVDLIQVSVIECLLREVLGGARRDCVGFQLLTHFLAEWIVGEVMMFLSGSMEEAEENLRFGQETTHSKRLVESTNWCRKVINRKAHIDFKVIDNFVEVKRKEVPVTIVHISKCEQVSRFILLNDVTL